MDDIVETLERLGAQAPWGAVEEAGADDAGVLSRKGMPAGPMAYATGGQPLNGMVFPAEEEEEQEEQGGEDEQSPPAAPSE
ncbi:hypothetical protein ACO2Q2_05360 [Dyella sp. KRB-257]|uniref:hypothetical protein n=1 Tax=Dyella sp. KRB-257 TaxID=3400915 RepID=UPI003C06497F